MLLSCKSQGTHPVASPQASSSPSSVLTGAALISPLESSARDKQQTHPDLRVAPRPAKQQAGVEEGKQAAAEPGG